MFVSNYSTYIQPNRVEKERQERQEISKESNRAFHFSANFKDEVPSRVLLTKQFPLDYVSSYKALYNQNRLQQTDPSLDQKQKSFSKALTHQQAKEAYLQNTTPFVLSKWPKLTLSQTPHLNADKTTELTQGRLKALRAKMIETYEQNDLYFKRSA